MKAPILCYQSTFFAFTTSNLQASYWLILCTLFGTCTEWHGIQELVCFYIPKIMRNH